MAIEQPTSALAVPYVVPAASYTLTVTDSFGAGRAVVFNAAALARTFRTFLAYTGGATPGTNSGTEADPDELLATLQTALNAAPGTTLWFVTLSAQGLVQIAYNGSGSGSVAFPSDKTLQNLLGITASGTGTLAGGTRFTAQYPPMFFASIPSRVNATDWTDVPPMVAAAQMETGDVYGNTSGLHGMRCQFDVTGMPRDAGQRASLASVLPPLFPPPGTRWTAPTRSTAALSASTASLPWTLYETLKTAFFTRLGFAAGNLQALAGPTPTDTLFFDVFLEPATLTRLGAIRLMVPGALVRSNWMQLGLRFKAQGSR